jgi:RNA polymerase sigma factor (TIGR02999 family)
VDDGSTSPDRATTEITDLLHAHAAGDASALDQLLPRVYGELRRIARLRLRRERDAHTLAATDLVHEAYLKLLPVERVDWRSRAHFFAIASRAMRNVLVDHAVRRGAAKRGAGATALALDDSDAAAAGQPLDDLIALSEALERLEQLDARQARVVECRFFGGLSLDVTAAALNTSAATVSRDWAFARAWLHHELAVGNAPGGSSPPSV